ncbi:MAG TPA: RagB/SusD family nutrient uptake outer membrane protein [Chitinophagaceae bacterium]|nr:RagB/SusD family nutrient uptake outer membrane protein [Chitinophagaceae bacterium]
MSTKFFNKLTTLVAICMTLLVSSCKKYLDQQPITEVGPSFVFSDVAHVQQALASVYSRLVGDQGYGIRLSLYYPLDNDAMQGPTGAADNDRRDIARYSATPGNAQLLKPFNQLFQGIEYANICIANIPTMDLYSKGSDQQKKQLQRMYGEALTLRAQFYLEAIRNWGDLPAQFQPAAVLALSNPLPGRTDRDSLYNQLLADLKTAEDLVPWRNEISSIGDPNDERITKGAVKGLRARIALYRGGYSLRQDGTMKRSADYKTYYQIARDECNDIITSGQHALNPSFKSLWKDQVCAHAVNDPDGELMFQASAIGQSGAEDTKLGYYDGPRVNNKGNNSVNPLPTYFYLFDSTDLRRDVTICHYYTNTNGTRAAQVITNMNDGKYRRDWITNPAISPADAVQYFGLKWQILRYSDVLLMFAEAENEVNGGPTTAAYNAINMVRRRGYGKPINTPDPTVDIPSGLSQSDFFKYIVRERALEFGGEGIRKYDLIRWNLLASAITETRTNLINMSTSTVLTDPSYMAGYPSYCKVTTLPTSMFMINNTTSDDNNIGGLWYNSLYNKAPSSTPSGTTKVTWVGSAINTTAASRFATGFVTGKGELLPIPQGARDADVNLTQNPGY